MGRHPEPGDVEWDGKRAVGDVGDTESKEPEPVEVNIVEYIVNIINDLLLQDRIHHCITGPRESEKAELECTASKLQANDWLV